MCIEVKVTDPETYSALVYTPPATTDSAELLPLLVVLHGAGRNDKATGPVEGSSWQPPATAIISGWYLWTCPIEGCECWRPMLKPISSQDSMQQQPQLPASTVQDAWDLANLQGEHGGLIPSLIASGQAPKELTENFVVVVTGTWSNGSSKQHLKA